MQNKFNEWQEQMLPMDFRVSNMIFKTVQIEIGLSEYGGNKKAVRTDGLLAKHQN